MEQFTTWHQSFLEYQQLLHRRKACQNLIRTSIEQKWVSRDREQGVSDTIDFLRFEQVEPTHRYRTRIFITGGIGSVTLDWRSNSPGRALGWCRLSRLISREAGSIRGREHCETAALMDELQTCANANSWQWSISCPWPYSAGEREERSSPAPLHAQSYKSKPFSLSQLPFSTGLLTCFNGLIKQITVNHRSGWQKPSNNVTFNLCQPTVLTKQAHWLVHWIQANKLLDNPDGFGGLGNKLKTWLAHCLP